MACIKWDVAEYIYWYQSLSLFGNIKFIELFIIRTSIFGFNLF
jgi:hypothetical protein